MKAKKDLLKEYRAKRSFNKTPEPKGTIQKSAHEPIFVIQKHAASHLHYDFRLEVNGVLKSWAVPKGPSINPKVKRLAIAVEDHPLQYADFEGIIPKGEYGAGEVMVWDIGTYTNIASENGKIVPMSKCIENGMIKIELHGEKLKGKYALVRTGKKPKEFWLLVKIRETATSNKKEPIEKQKLSALTHRSLEEIAENKSNKNKKL